MDLEQYMKDFNDDIKEDALSKNEYEVNILTEKYKTFLVESGECINPIVGEMNIKGYGMKINAYDLQLEDNALDLFITYFDDSNTMRALSERQVCDELKKVEKLISKINEKFDQFKDDEYYEPLLYIQSQFENINRVKIYFITNRIVKDIQLTERIINDKTVTYHLCDIEKLYQDSIGKATKQTIKIDFKNDFGKGLRYIHTPVENDTYESYVTIIEGKVIAEIYKTWGQRLIEKNIRSFLQAKGNVNKGIKNTIKNEPEMFMAYNNGISATADDITIGRSEEGELEIFDITNLQIVNGGQTTASLYEALKNDENLDNVYVQMKITKINNRDNEEQIVSNISKFANSQTKINASDFSANNQYHIDIEEYSRKIWVPNKLLGKGTTKWFYERVRGQYLVELNRQNTKSKKERFKNENPNKQKFNKTDLAKYVMSWEQYPHIVGRGSEYNFAYFMNYINTNDTDHGVNEEYYKKIISLAILFNETDSIVKKLDQGGYKANVVAYTIAALSKKNSSVDLNSIWENQKLDEELKNEIQDLAKQVFKYITNPPQTGANVTQWCKKEECWKGLIEFL